MAAAMKIGDKVTHSGMPGMVYTIFDMEPSGNRTILAVKDNNGRTSKFWAHECELVRQKPAGSWITW